VAGNFYPTSTRQRVAMLLASIFEDAIKSKAEGNKERYYELVDALIPWLLDFMPKKVREYVINVANSVTEETKKIAEGKGSPEDKRAEILRVKYEAAEKLYPIMVITFWNSSFLTKDMEGEILQGVEDMDEFRRIRKEMLETSMKTLVTEGGDGDDVGSDTTT